MNNNKIIQQVINSPIRWAGSKKKLLNEMLKTFDTNKKIYVEPFLGSGIVFLNVLNNDLYNKYYINDINGSISGFFEMLSKGNQKFIDELDEISHNYNNMVFEKKEDYYYEVRKEYNSLLHDYGNDNQKRKFVLFWFLMKTGFNGVYRVNSHGQFNVPFGRKKKIQINLDELKNICSMMKNVQIYNCDYKTFILEVLSKEDIGSCFIYMDPPYLNKVEGGNNSRLYTHDQFNHQAFVDFIIENNHRFTYMISMEDHDGSRYYYDQKFSKIKLNDIIRTINPKKIFKAIELGYCNYITSTKTND